MSVDAPTLYEVQQDVRAKLMALDGETSDRLFRAYLPVLTNAKTTLDDLATKANNLQLAGQALTRTLLYRSLRLDVAVAQIAAQMGRFGQAVSPFVSQEVEQAVALAQGSSRALMTAAIGPLPRELGVPENFLRFNEGAVKEVLASFGEGSPYLTVYANYKKATSALLEHSFVQAIVDGENPLAVARNLSKTLDIPLTSARTTARTVIVGAFRSASIAEYQANSQIVQRWRWTCSKSSRTCPVCLAMDGQEFPLDEPFISHLSCRCSASPVTASWQDLGIDAPDLRPEYQTGDQWFAKQDEKTQESILGKGKLYLYKHGDITLQDLVGEGSDPKWGDYRYTKPLKDFATQDFARDN